MITCICLLLQVQNFKEKLTKFQDIDKIGGFLDVSVVMQDILKETILTASTEVTHAECRITHEL